MKKATFKVVAILILGALGGLLFQVLVLPWMITEPFFGRFQFVKNLKERQVVVNPKEEIIITENLALQEAVEKVKKTTVALNVRTQTGTILQGSGLILTSDGLAVTLNELLPQGSSFDVFVGQEEVEAEIQKRDILQNLVLIKIEKMGLKTLGFADLEKVKLGERVFLVGKIFNNEGVPQNIINQGIVKFFDQNQIKTNIFENYLLKGSSLFNIEGNVLGLNTVDFQGKVVAIPADKIKEFVGF